MEEIDRGLTHALQLIIAADPAVMQIIFLSLQVTGLALVISTLIGVPLGALIAMTVIALVTRHYKRDFAREFGESLRVKSAMPLGEPVGHPGEARPGRLVLDDQGVAGEVCAGEREGPAEAQQDQFVEGRVGQEDAEGRIVGSEGCGWRQVEACLRHQDDTESR